MRFADGIGSGGLAPRSRKGIRGRQAGGVFYPLRSLGFAATMLVGLAASAIAQPPPNANPKLAPWFRSLLQPGTNLSCCSIADCRTTDYRIEHNHYEALIGKRWLDVPPDKILQRTDNPTGRAVVCWTPQLGIMCFVRATES
jgi:hypothetical protein